MHTDKGRKQLLGLSIAREYDDSHVMFLDADDLVSCRLAGHVEDNRNSNGWCFSDGYLMFSDDCRWLYHRKRFFEECGSSHIIRTDLCPFPPTFDLSRNFDDYHIRRFTVHAYLAEALAKAGHPLEPLSFPGAIYRCHDSNIYANTRSRRAFPRNVIRKIVRGRRMTPTICAEFSIPKMR